MKSAAPAITMAAAMAACLLTACMQAPAPSTSTSTQPAPPAAPKPDAPPPAAPPPAPAPTPMPPVEAALPARFQGTWAIDTAACAVPGHESRLVLSGDRVKFHESEGAIRSVAVNGDDVTLVAMLTGEGQTREASYRFSLSGDATLVDRDGGLVRTRCR
ncbi:hypothetical protein [Agrilutibacter solisilvae]|uniref:C-type lysozyme inhibitor domain-containing protein n=1 Tax=Agrilutibacter solisilvae TaxID=2763317 RepID=A0A974XXY0_9GAMM|nr:hypothetical protein [Lysobacter solisilvae]QSX77846.1 hypothetical protein I8J32_014115 [Lysobacter solisilvae]